MSCILQKKTNLEIGDLLAYIIHEPGEATKSDDPFYSMLYKKIKELDKKVVLLRVVNVIKKPVTELLPELDYCSWAKMMLYDWCGEEIPDKAIADSLDFLPIVVEYGEGKRKIVSNITLDFTDDMKKFGEIVYLGRNSSFISNTPMLYLQNDGSPSLSCPHLNMKIALTFLRLRGEDIWYYSKD